MRINSKTAVIAVLMSLALFIAGCGTFYDLPEADEESLPSLDGNYSRSYPLEDDELEDHISGQIIAKVDQEKINNLLEKFDIEIIREIEKAGHYLFQLEEGASVGEKVREINKKEYVSFAQPNFVVETINSFEEIPRFYRGEQYGLEKINAKEAWEVTTGSGNTVIAVLDTGVDEGHPELSGRVLVEEGINTLEEYPEENTDDVHGHGTHVSGIAAAGGPGEGEMAGVSWESLILPVKVLGDDGVGDIFSVNLGIIHSINYAIENPDKRVVINMSLGGRGVSPARDQIVDMALEAGVPVIASMGNDYKNIIATPASNQGVIAVGATDVNNEKANFSSTGDWISVSAPGEDILSSLPGGSYARWSGTSMSAPFVAGAAALILEENPDLSPGDVKYHLERTADDLGTPGFNPEFGHGIINVGRALKTDPEENPYGSFYVKVTYEGETYQDVPVRLYKDEEYLWTGVTSLFNNEEAKAIFHDLKEGDYRLDVVQPGLGVIKEKEVSLEAKETKTVKMEIDDYVVIE